MKMKLRDAIRKILALIEEYNPESELLTDDPDISAKIYDVINQVMYELARLKKIPRFLPLPVVSGDVVSFQDLSKMIGNSVYQLGTVRNVRYESRADGTVLKFTEDGTAEIDLFVYPRRITPETSLDYEFELSDDVLEILPYGVAADLLKSDQSAEYGSVYGTRYEQMLNRLDPRNQMTGIYFDGGVRI